MFIFLEFILDSIERDVKWQQDVYIFFKKINIIIEKIFKKKERNY